MKVLTFDTETTDKGDFNAPPLADHQPHVVQLGAVLEDFASDTVMASVNILITPEKWEIKEGAQKVHGISQKTATDFGVGHVNACWLFRDLVYACDVAVNHNLPFDIRVMQKALHVANVDPIPWEKIPQRCTMRASTAICKLPKPKGGPGFKWPTLEEALRILCGEQIDGAHDALVDVNAARKVHRELVKRGAFGR